MKSVIKYYGGKSYMTDIIISNFPDTYEVYVEGFGGGASVLFKKEKTPIEIYNDLGENVYSLFKVLSDKDMFERLRTKMELTYYSEELMKEYSHDLKGNDLSMEDRAYKFLFVNRAAFNGIGGFSIYQVVRRNMSKSTSDYLSLIDRLPEIHNRLSSVIIEHKDIMKIIDRYDNEKTFMYLDPPYVKSTRLSDTSYEVEMDDNEHLELCKRLLNCKCKVLLSGYDNEIYKILDSKFTKISFPSPNSGSTAIECLWKNY